MDNLESQIDTLERDKLVSLLQENAVRVTKVNIKYTKNNKKNTLDRWQAYFDSYDRLFRSIPREIIRVEKEVRKKFMSSLTSERVTKLKTFVNREAQVLVKKLEKECGAEFEKLGKKDEFDARLEKSLNKLQSTLEEQISKCQETLDSENSQDGKVKVEELCRMYEIRERLINELNLVEPLQNLNLAFNEIRKRSMPDYFVGQIQETLQSIVRNIQNDSAETVSSVKDRKNRKIQVARESMALRDVVIHCQYLVDQILKAEGQRNPELAKQIWGKLENLLETGRPDWSAFIPNFKSAYEFFQEIEKSGAETS